MIYVLDTNIIRKICFHLPKKGLVFENIWNAIAECIKEGEVISVDECFNEIEKQFAPDNESFIWVNEHKCMFQNPTNEESLVICEIFKDPKYRESIHTKNIRENRPSADVYLVAKAKCIGGVIVTAEEYKPNSAQLPNFCEAFGVTVISYDDFMEYIQSKI